MSTHVKILKFNETVESWTSYSERLEYSIKANDIVPEKQHAMLNAACGPSTYQLLKSLVQQAKLEDKDLVKLLGEHFNPKPSSIGSRYRFNKRDRRQGESIYTFVAEFRGLAEHCQFGSTLNDMIRDRLVCSISDSQIQRRPLQETDLTYESAYKIAQAMKATSKDAQDLQKAVQGQSIQQVDNNREQVICHRCKGRHLASTRSF